MGTLVVGLPSEIKDNEKRVALTPDVAQAYVRSVEGAETGRIFRLPA